MAILQQQQAFAFQVGKVERVAANVGVTLLPTLAVKPPVARSEDIVLLPFRGSHPSRRIAMAWRKSSAMGGFLAQLAQVFRQLPPQLFVPEPGRRREASVAVAAVEPEAGTG